MERRSILTEEYNLDWSNNISSIQNRYYNYSTLYLDKKIARRHHHNDVCFSYICHSTYNKMTIRIPKKYTFYTKSDIIEYLKFLSQFELKIDISYRVISYKDYYLITVKNIVNKYHAKIFCTMIRNLYEEDTYYLTHIPYWQLYAYNTFKELNVLQCNVIGHMYKRDMLQTGGHCVLYYLEDINIDLDDFKEKLENTINVQEPFIKYGNDSLNLRNYGFKTKEELKEQLIKLKWITN